MEWGSGAFDAACRSKGQVDNTLRSPPQEVLFKERQRRMLEAQRATTQATKPEARWKEVAQSITTAKERDSVTAP